MRAYAGMFLIAMATLAFEIALSRMLSVVTWYHLGFFAISVAMLGMTAGAITVFLAPGAFTEPKLVSNVRRACVAFAVTIPLALAAICFLPIRGDLFGPGIWTNLPNVFAITVAVALPFYFSGIAISALLTQVNKPVNRLYASDLLGAASGCIVVLIGLSWLDTPSFIIVIAAMGLMSAVALSEPNRLSTRALILIALCTPIIAYVNSAYGVLQPRNIKGYVVNYNNIDMHRWNSFSQVGVYSERVDLPQVLGGSLRFYEHEKLPWRKMLIDGEAGTFMRRYQSPQDIEHLRYDVTNIAYFLRPPGNVAVIGVGGARDIQAALLFENDHVLGVELNPIFVDLLNDEYQEFAGVGNKDNVRLVVDEARSHFSHSRENFDVIQMSLIDTWAATGAGAFTLSENSLYTVEAWNTFLERLSSNGVFSVSRWFNKDDLGETGRMLSLAVATLLDLGVAQPADHIAMVTHELVATLILSRDPMSDTDIARLVEVSKHLEHDIAVLPGTVPANETLTRIIQARSVDELYAISDKEDFNIRPPTDESPYFFNMLKLENLQAGIDANLMSSGVIRGNLTATISLIMLIAILTSLAVITIIVPLLCQAYVARKRINVDLPSGLFFACIGAAFMAVEIGLLQRLSVFLGHPVYALGVLLFGIIASTGIGSLLSERLDLMRRRNVIILPLATAAFIVLIDALINEFMGTLITYSMPIKIATSVAVIFPVGLLLGCFFPTAMQLVKLRGDSETAWYWAINGVFGVLFSALAVFISIYLGITVNFYLGAALYVVTMPCLWSLARQAQFKDSAATVAARA